MGRLSLTIVMARLVRASKHASEGIYRGIVLE